MRARTVPSTVAVQARASGPVWCQCETSFSVDRLRIYTDVRQKVRHFPPMVRQNFDSCVSQFTQEVRHLCDSGVGHFTCMVSQKSD